MNTLIIYLAAIFKNPLRNVAGRERVVNRFIPRIWDKVNLDNGYALYILEENSLNLEESMLSSTWTYIYRNRGFSGSYDIDYKPYTLPEILVLARKSGFEILYGDGACIYAFTTQSKPTGISAQNCLK